MSIPAQGAVGAGNTDATAWLKKRMKAAISDSEAHPEGHPNRTFYGAQAIAYENVLSLLEKEKRIAAALASPRADSDERTAGEAPWGIEEADGRIWVGPLARDGAKVDAFVFEMDIRDIGPEAQERSRADARRVVNAINATPAQPAGAVPDSLRALSEAVREYGKAEWSAGYATGSYGEGPNPDVTDRLSNVLNSLSLLLASHPAGQSAGSGAEHQRDMALEALHTLGVRLGVLDPSVACDGPQLLTAMDAYSDSLTAPDSTRTGQGGGRTPYSTRRARHQTPTMIGRALGMT